MNAEPATDIVTHDAGDDALKSHQVYGQITEGVHLAGYTLERAYSSLEWLLTGDRWRCISAGHGDINSFLESIRPFEGFRLMADQRKRIAKQIKELQPDASQRKIAKVLGVDHQTINNDLRPGERSPTAPHKASKLANMAAGGGETSPTPLTPPLGGAEAARLIESTLEKAERRKAAPLAAVERTRNVELDAASLGKFAVVYADPPWRYENPPMGATSRSIENHYPTMTLDEICALPVSSIAHENAVLFMWATSPKLADCFDVLKAWGFNYRTSMVWVKDKIGMGYHVRGCHEIILIAKRGELPPPPSESRPDSVLEAARGDHSAKPQQLYTIIDAMYPGVRKIELFGRHPEPRDGWSVWGNQA